MEIVSQPINVLKLLQTDSVCLADKTLSTEIHSRTRLKIDAGPDDVQLFKERGIRADVARMFTVNNWDFLMTKNDGMEWYSSDNLKEHRVTVWKRTEVDIKTGKSRWEIIKTWSRAGPNHVYAVEDRRFFVSDTGDLDVGTLDGKPESASEHIPVEDGIQVMIDDQDLGKIYAFTYSHYFELGDLKTWTKHGIPIPKMADYGNRVQEADESMALAAKCARVVRGLPEPKAKLP